ncbi:hypothetical protein CEXT_279831 [Caerostris extrusa]|uniref:Uncharacterized protein n=1 Tax=Caerostris extrusa TaxID=172846 RepID=A0AAV4XPI8_CAEEX|nr:hypothetical protein CEXT_279831 [Caerostris extrusa]
MEGHLAMISIIMSIHQILRLLAGRGKGEFRNMGQETAPKRTAFKVVRTADGRSVSVNSAKEKYETSSLYHGQKGFHKKQRLRNAEEAAGVISRNYRVN